ncbi:hypothetical protein GA0111570_104109 [Raineyella antarctica]|uniref:Uncharacterized protein n=1 Tax=Raineyella antarctica TaxID=1577474 RepID=A0A1G6GMP5_9ACTN|nr:hypothetical protein [Raineyella antarctica]SDB83228.1 hypothetical protein GA0111570_104109 [Raineyella antarctica]
METALIIFGVLAVMAALAGGAALSVLVHRAVVTYRARRPITMGERSTTPAEVFWEARELSESPHVRAIARRDIGTSEQAVLAVQETLASLPPNHRADARLQHELLSSARAARASTTDGVRLAEQGSPRELAAGVSEGLLNALSQTALPGRPAITAALESGRTAQAIPGTGIEAVDRAVRSVQGWLGTYVPVAARPGFNALGGTVGQLTSGLGAMARDLAQSFSSSTGFDFGALGTSTGPAGSRLLRSMDDLGQQVSPAMLHQLVERSDEAVAHVTACVDQLEREFRPAGRRETWRRTYWPSLGDVVAQDALVHGRQVLVRENETHRALQDAVRSLDLAEARVRGTAWALVQRDVRPGTFVGPDLASFAGQLEDYVSEQRRSSR